MRLFRESTQEKSLVPRVAFEEIFGKKEMSFKMLHIPTRAFTYFDFAGSRLI